MTLSERFWAKADRRASDDCWPWNGSLHYKGYGQIKVNGKVRKAHRVAWELAEGRPVAEGFVLDHLCRNRWCVNPDHLEEVRPVENVLRGISFAAVNSRKTHCAHGHELTGDNVRLRPSGARRCLQCVKDYNERQAANRVRAEPEPGRDKTTGRYARIGDKK